MIYFKPFTLFFSVFSMSLVANAGPKKDVEISDIVSFLESERSYISRSTVDGFDHSCQVFSFLFDTSEPEKILYLPEGDKQLRDYPDCKMFSNASQKLLSFIDESFTIKDKSSLHRMLNLGDDVVELGGMQIANIKSATYDEDENILTLTLFAPLFFSEKVYRIDLDSKTSLKPQN